VVVLLQAALAAVWEMTQPLFLNEPPGLEFIVEAPIDPL
jgi:hypothetical protein